MSITSYSNKWAVITGASDGIGRALVHELAKKNFNVVAIGRSEPKMHQLVAEFDGPTTLETHCMDFSHPGSGQAISQVILDKDVEIFSPAAGFGSSGDFVDLNLNRELEIIDVNCRAVVEQTQIFAQEFKAKGRGTIIMYSSILGMTGAGTTATYSATKNFIQAFSEGLRSELRPFGVKVITVCPAVTDTGFAGASQMSFSSADSASRVAKGIVNNLAHNSTLYPTPRARFLGLFLTLVPRTTRVSILSKFMSGVTLSH